MNINNINCIPLSYNNVDFNGTTKNQPTSLSKAIESAKDNQVIYLTTNDKQDTYRFTDEIFLYSNDNLHNLLHREHITFSVEGDK